MGFAGNERELTKLASLPGPPELSEDLKSLRAQQAKRTPADLRAIVEEIDVCGWQLGSFQFGLDPERDEFLASIFYDAGNIGLHLKEAFDRPRPTYCDASLTPAISVPLHPAFPSNHSVEAHILAMVLADLDPLNRDRLLARADEIARHREVAGLHYPSDTLFGAKVAEWVYQRIRADSRYLKRLAELRASVAKGPPRHRHVSSREACDRFFTEYRKQHGMQN